MALKWENMGDTQRARSDSKIERWWTIRPCDDGAWYLRAPDGVGSIHASLSDAKHTAGEDHKMGIR